jgi:hypothetical protein
MTVTMADDSGADTGKRGAARRRPGRPPKRQPLPPLEKKGVVDSPTDPAHRMELVYENPALFKSLFSYFKNLKAIEVHILCEPAGVTFLTRDAAQACLVVAEIPGAEMNHYYCAAPTRIGLQRENVERVFSCIDSSFFKATLVLRNDDPDTLQVIFKDSEIDKECIYEFALSTLDPDPPLFDARERATPAALREAPVEFCLAAKKFKKTVSDAFSLHDTLTIQKAGGGGYPLCFQYTKVTVNYQEVYRDGEKIDLRSDVAPGTLFRCIVPLANVRSLATAMVTDSVRVFCFEDSIRFRSEIGAMTMTTVAALDN